MEKRTTIPCPACDAPLEVDGVCLACLFGEALEAGESGPPRPTGESAFGRFVPLEAGTYGKFKLRCRIGSGGMGVIWEAEETITRRVVALKMIRGFMFATEAERQRFRTETAAIAQLDHPHIVPIYEVGEIEAQPFFTMKLLQGGNLSQRLEAGALPATEAAHLMEKLARAVQHAHAHGVLHRDLKPGNVLFDLAGEPFVADFGLAKLVHVEQGLTLSSAQVGTPHYMSPEQARGDIRDITTASDVWALGVMLYRMLSGRLPFPGETPAEVFNRVTSQDPPALQMEAGARDLETLCLRCLEKEPARRVSSAGELADELERWRLGEPILSRRVTARERTLRWVRRHPLRVTAVTGFALSLLVGSVVSLLLWRNAETSRAVAEVHREEAVRLAASERLAGYISTMAAALAARERHDFSRARQLLAAAPPEHRGLEWRLLHQLCKGDERALFRLPDGGIPEALGVGPDGRSLAVVTGSGVLHLLQPDGSPLRAPRPLPGLQNGPDLGRATSQNYHSLHYAPGGRHFACSFRNTLRVFDADTLEVLVEVNDVIHVQSGWLDEHRLLFGQNVRIELNPGGSAWVFDVRDRRKTPLPAGWAAPLTVARESGLIALTEKAEGHLDVVVFRLEDLEAGRLLAGAKPVARRSPWISSASVVALSHDGKYLATLGGDMDAPFHVLEVSEIATGNSLVAQVFSEPMTGLAFHPTRSLVALTGSDGVVRLFDFLKPVSDRIPAYDDDCAPAIRQPLDGNRAHGPGRRLLTRSALGGGAAFLLGHEGRATGVSFASDGSRLFSASVDGTVRAWDPAAPAPALRLTNAHLYKHWLHPSASDEGSRVLHGSLDRATWYWRDGVGFTRLAEDHMPLAVLPGAGLATMERESSDIILWEEDGEDIRETARISGPGYIQDFSELQRGLVTPDGTKIIGATPGRLFVVDLETRRVTASGDLKWQLGDSRIWGLALSPDGRHIAVTAFAHQTKIFDTGDLTKEARTVGAFRHYDTSVAFHPDGSRLYCGNEDGRVRAFDTATWQEIPEESWQAHHGAITAIAVSHDTRRIATAGDTTLKLWLTKTAGSPAPTEILSFSTYYPSAWLHFGRDPHGSDRSLMHCQPFSSLEIWPCGSGEQPLPGPARPSQLKVRRASR